jgi:hypothetical protein
VVEDLRQRLQLHVRVHERAAADPRGRDHRDVAHQPHVEEPARVHTRVPEQLRRVVRIFDEVGGSEPAAALEDADSLARLREPARGDAASEPGAHDHGVVRPLHGETLISRDGLR